jgi:predicted nucleic acid-binding protein
MSSRTIAVQSHAFKTTDAVLIDTNILLYVYGPQGSPSDWKSRLYSHVLKELFRAKSAAIVDALIISEFVNRYCRQEYTLYLESNSKIEFKDFRKTIEFEAIAAGIAAVLKQIMNLCSRVGSGFDCLNIDNFIYDYAQKRPDFNDLVLVELCKSKGFMLLTHDSDFKDYDITILTANKKILC